MSGTTTEPKPRRGRPPKGAPIRPEIGHAGLSVSSGAIREARDLTFHGKAWRTKIGEMIDSDPILGGIFLGIDLKIQKAGRNLTPADDSPEATRQAEFFATAFEDMNQPFGMTIPQITTMAQYGWSYFETVFKMRMGSTPRDQVLSDGTTNRPPASKHDDGLIGWHKWGHRHPDTLVRWEFGPHGSLRGMVQRDPATGNNVVIPIQRSLLFRPKFLKGNPEGKSTLTNAYRPWYFKRNLEQIRAMGAERELTGAMKLFITENLLDPDATDEEVAALAKYVQMMQDLREDPNTILILPSLFDQSGNRIIDIEPVASAGTRQFDIDAMISYYDNRMAFATLAQFMLLGTEKVGSFALSSTQADLFLDAVNNWAAAIADVINGYGIRRLAEVNGWDAALSPVFSFSRITDISMRDVAEYLQRLKNAGATIFPNEQLAVDLLRRAGLPTEGLPDPDEEAEKALARRQQMTGGAADGEPDDDTDPDKDGPKNEDDE